VICIAAIPSDSTSRQYGYRDCKKEDKGNTSMERKQEESNPQPEYLCPTRLLDFDSLSIQKLLKERGWEKIQRKKARIEAVYQFVRDEIAYGYNEQVLVKASEVLSQGYGQGITKSILLMALLRGVGIPCRYHAFTVDKILQRGILKGAGYKLQRTQMYHSWVEIFFEKEWICIEGHIVDKPYIEKLQALFPDYMGSFYAYGLAVLNFRNPPNKWEGNHTYVQSRAIEDDLGIFDCPDDFFARYPDADTFCKKYAYRKLIRPVLNKNIKAIREQLQ
jgi:transglutaminase-like putative cysteine protease